MPHAKWKGPSFDPAPWHYPLSFSHCYLPLFLCVIVNTYIPNPQSHYFWAIPLVPSHNVSRLFHWLNAKHLQSLSQMCFFLNSILNFETKDQGFSDFAIELSSKISCILQSNFLKLSLRLNARVNLFDYSSVISS